MIHLIAAVFFLLCSFLFGILISSHLKFLDDWWKKTAFALGFGTLVSMWLTFALSYAFNQLSDTSIYFSSIIMLVAFLKFYKHRRFHITQDITGLIFCLIILGILAFLNFRLLPHMENGNMVSGGNIWGDYPFHLGIINSFAERPNYPPKYPILVTANLAYPFMVNFFSAILLRGGFDLFYSLLIPHFIFYFILISFLYYLGMYFSGKRKLAGMILVLLFLFNGNLGGYFALKDAFATNDPINFLMHPPVAYSHYHPSAPNVNYEKHEGPNNMEFMNQLFSTFIPQRSAIMGIALSILFYFIVFQSLKKPEKFPLLVAGLILGLMPLVHGHTFLMCAFFSPFAFAYSLLKAENKKEAFHSWLYFIAPSLLLSIPQLLFMKSQFVSTDYLKFRLGWMQDSPISAIDFLVYWFSNFGLILPLAIIGLLLAPNQLRLLFIPFILAFAFGNLYQLAPWDWDTIKIFTGFFLFICIFASIALDKLFNSKRILWKKPISSFSFKILTVLFIILCILSGVLSLFWWYGDQPVLYSQRDFTLASWIMNNTPADAIWITSDAHNHVVPSLTGRQTVLGLKWYLHSHGLDALKNPAENDINSFFQNADCAIPKKYGATYLMIGIHEDSIEHANRAAFENKPNYNKIYDETLFGYRETIYKINC